jgi:hypothetical protein
VAARPTEAARPEDVTVSPMLIIHTLIGAALAALWGVLLGHHIREGLKRLRARRSKTSG